MKHAKDFDNRKHPDRKADRALVQLQDCSAVFLFRPRLIASFTTIKIRDLCTCVHHCAESLNMRDQAIVSQRTRRALYKYYTCTSSWTTATHHLTHPSQKRARPRLSLSLSDATVRRCNPSAKYDDSPHSLPHTAYCRCICKFDTLPPRLFQI